MTFLGLNLDRLYALKRPTEYSLLLPAGWRVLKPVGLCWLLAVVPTLLGWLNTSMEASLANGCQCGLLNIDNVRPAKDYSLGMKNCL